MLGCIYQFMFKISINKVFSREFESLRPHQSEFYIGILMDKLLSVIFMVGVLLLVLPSFLQSNSQLKQFLKNLSIWIIVVFIILMIVYLFK